MRINNNVTAINTHRMYGINAGNLGRTVERLSSGFRVNRAADDAAGLAISEKMRAQIRGLNMASRNSLDAVSLVQVAEGALAVVQNIAHRIRELAVQGASDVNTPDDRRAIAKEVWQLSREILEMESLTEFNTMRLFDGNSSFPRGADPPNEHSLDGLRIQVGANQNQVMTIEIDFRSLMIDGYYTRGHGLLFCFSSRLNHIALALEGRAGRNDILNTYFNYTGNNNLTLDDLNAMGIGHLGGALGNLNAAAEGLTQQEWISRFINTQADSVINHTSMARAKLGAYQNRLEFKIQNLDNQAENLQAAESRIRDADMAQLMTKFTRNNILFQASTAMLAQANALPMSVLQLLG